MKVVIFAGGKGTRISEESHLKPKPMIEIGGKPILWHIMKIYEAYGHHEFIICLGYKGYVIKEYFMNYFLHNADITLDLGNNKMEVHNSKSENFKVTLVETGLETMTAGRLKRVQKYTGNEDFMLTYGDGVANVNLDELLKFHQQNNKIATMTAIQPGSRFGVMDIAENGEVKAFREKPKDDGAWINGGFFI
ncbi:MAG: glucose-1-phosphate cytidylyltransferase, partial [Bacteroidetes bacterium]|nr:glucose-1-phosphate cytidylyltransferase [Bacteroidota bacterium]